MSVFLTSKGFYVPEVLQGFIEHINKQNIPKEICMITTAIRDQDDRKFHMAETEKVLKEVGFLKVDFLDVEFDDPNTLKEYPIICLFGGHPFVLLDLIKKSQTDNILSELHSIGKLIVGHSAGAAVLGKTIRHAHLLHPEWNDIDLTNFDALGIIQGVVLPHSNRYTNQEERLSEFELHEEGELLRIADGEFLIL